MASGVRARLGAIPPAAWALLALALLCRVAVVIAWPHERPQLDAVDYDAIARSLAGGHGFPDSVFTAGGGPAAIRPPAYPVMLGGVYAVAGHHYVAARLVQALIGTLSVALLGLLANRLIGRRVAIAALAIGAVYPVLIAMDTALLSESLFTALMLGALVCAFEARASERPLPWAVGCGVVLGLATLTRQNALLLLLPVWMAISDGPQPGRVRMRAALVVLGFTVLTVAPWTIRNTVEFHSFVPVATQSGVLLAGMYNDHARADPVFPAAWRPPNAEPEYADLFADPSLNEAELDAKLRRRAVRYARDHKGYVASAFQHNVRRMLHLHGTAFERFADADRNMVGDLARPARWSFYVVALLAIAGAFTACARRAPLYLWLVPFLMFVSGAFFSGLVRYRLALDPFLVLLAAALVVAVTGRLRARPPLRAEASPARGPA